MWEWCITALQHFPIQTHAFLIDQLTRQVPTPLALTNPRKVDAATVALLGELGFNRMSLGVQDFDSDVQRAVNRIQSEEETLAPIMRSRGTRMSATGLSPRSADESNP